MAAISGTRTEQEKKEEDGENRWIDQTGHNCAAAAAAIEDTTWTQSVSVCVSWRQQEKNNNKKKKQTRNGAKAASSKKQKEQRQLPCKKKC